MGHPDKRIVHPSIDSDPLAHSYHIIPNFQIICLIVEGEPESVGRGAVDAVAAMCGDDEGMAGGDFQGFAGFESEIGFTTEQEHPFGALGIIPKTIRA